MLTLHYVTLRDVDTYSDTTVVVWFEVSIILHLLTVQMDTFRYKERTVRRRNITNIEETSSEVE